MSSIQFMIDQARLMMDKSHSPYSNFRVGTCLKTDAGNYYYGCNIENASYSLTLCAEACAIANMVSAGEQTINEVVVVSSGTQLCAPCGACRQRILEFATIDTRIHVCDQNGLHKTMLLEELLPLSFNKQNLIEPNLL